MSLSFVTEGLSLQIKTSAQHGSLPWALDGLGEILIFPNLGFPAGH